MVRSNEVSLALEVGKGAQIEGAEPWPTLCTSLAELTILANAIKLCTSSRPQCARSFVLILNNASHSTLIFPDHTGHRSETVLLLDSLYSSQPDGACCGICVRSCTPIRPLRGVGNATTFSWLNTMQHLKVGMVPVRHRWVAISLVERES